MSANHSMDTTPGNCDLLESHHGRGELTGSASQPASSHEPQSSMDTSNLSSKGAATCQVAGCGADLAELKEYHQRYKICAHHFKVGDADTLQHVTTHLRPTTP